MSNNRNEGYSEVRSALNFAEFIAGLFAKTTTVFFRHDFGTRYFSWSNAIGSTLTILIGGVSMLFIIAAITGATPKDIEMFPLLAFLLGFVVISIVHNLLALHYKKQRPFWHSRYTGTSYLETLLPDEWRGYLNQKVFSFFGFQLRYVIQRFVEPLITIATGFLTGYVLNAPLGGWLMFAGLSVAAIEWLNATRYNRRITDAMDAQIEAQWIGEAVTTTTPDANKTNGFVLPVPSYLKPDARKLIYNGMVRLDPALQAIMDEPELEPRVAPTPEETIANILDEEPKESWEI